MDRWSCIDLGEHFPSMMHVRRQGCGGYVVSSGQSVAAAEDYQHAQPARWIRMHGSGLMASSGEEVVKQNMNSTIVRCGFRVTCPVMVSRWRWAGRGDDLGANMRETQVEYRSWCCGHVELHVLREIVLTPRCR